TLHGNSELLKKLLLRGVPISEVSLSYAIEEGYTDIVRLLLNHDPNLIYSSTNLEEVICFAVKKGFSEIMRVLCEKGLKPDQLHFNNIGLLHIAIIQGDFSMVKILLDGKADMNRTTEGHTMLYTAAQ